MTLKIFLLIILAEIAATITQIFFKKGTGQIPDILEKGIRYNLRFVQHVLHIPLIWCGLITITISTTLWLTVLAQAQLSLAFSFDSMQYIMILIGSSIFLGERMTWLKILGTLSIIAGMIFVALG